MNDIDDILTLVRKMEMGEAGRNEWLTFDDGTDVSGIYTGAGTPEASVAADIGSLYLDTTNGVLYRKTSDTANTGWILGAAGISATANETSVVNSATEQTVGIADNPILPGSGSVTLPSGTTGQQPGSPTAGMVRYNSTKDRVETYIDAQWVDLSTEWFLIQEQAISGSPTKLLFNTGFDHLNFSEYCLRFDSIGGSVSSYPQFEIYDDGGTTPLTCAWLWMNGSTLTGATGTGIHADNVGRSGTAKRGCIYIKVSAALDSQFRGPIFSGLIFNTVYSGGFWGTSTGDDFKVDAIALRQAAGTISGSNVQLYGRR